MRNARTIDSSYPVYGLMLHHYNSNKVNIVEILEKDSPIVVCEKKEDDLMAIQLKGNSFSVDSEHIENALLHAFLDLDIKTYKAEIINPNINIKTKAQIEEAYQQLQKYCHFGQ